jgi:hypothetical protein
MAERAHEMAIEAGRRAGGPTWVISELTNLGTTLRRTGKPASAVTAYERAVAELQPDMEPSLRATVLINAATP